MLRVRQQRRAKQESRYHTKEYRKRTTEYAVTSLMHAHFYAAQVDAPGDGLD